MIALLATAALVPQLRCAARPHSVHAQQRMQATADRRAVIGGERWLTHAPLDYFALDKLTGQGLRANTDVGQPHDSSRR